MPLYSFAAIIITQNDERLEDESIGLALNF